jgi:uncharacterized membrane protein
MENITFGEFPDAEWALVYIGGQVKYFNVNLPPGIGSIATGINKSGLLTGYNITPSDQAGGFLYDSVSGSVDSIPPLSGASDSWGLAINDQGTVAGRSGGHGFSFSGGVLKDLGPLFSPGDEFSRMDINDSGQIVATFGDPSSASSVPVIYDPSKPAPAFVKLPMPSGFGTGVANGINSSGDVVGWANDGGDGQVAFICFQGTIAKDLNSMIPRNTGWLLASAIDVNDSGEIVGKGTLNGRNALFLLRPIVVPRALGVLGLIVVLLGGGVQAGAGGTGFTFSGVPIPVPIPIESWGNLSAIQQDILIGLATDELARNVNNKDGRHSLRRAALELVKASADEVLNSLTDD